MHEVYSRSIVLLIRPNHAFERDAPNDGTPLNANVEAVEKPLSEKTATTSTHASLET